MRTSGSDQRCEDRPFRRSRRARGVVLGKLREGIFHLQTKLPDEPAKVERGIVDAEPRAVVSLADPGRHDSRCGGNDRP